jgi:hypothetical protein
LTRADSALLLNHKLSNFGIFRDGLDRLCDRWVSDLACHVEPIQCHRTPRQIDLTAVGDLEGCRRILEIDLGTHARERNASIHRAGVEEEKPKIFGEFQGYGTLSGPGRPVDCHDHRCF